MTRATLVLLLVAGLLAGLTSIGSALATSSVDLGSSPSTAGSVILTTIPISTLVSFDNMAPGDQVTAPIIVTNGGTLQFRYAVTSVATNTDSKGLRNQLVLTVKSGVTTCTDGGFGVSGTQQYTGMLGSDSGAKVIGDPATGEQSGDRTLAAGANEVLCFHVALPIDTADTFQSAATTATFTFAAEQTASNP